MKEKKKFVHKFDSFLRRIFEKNLDRFVKKLFRGLLKTFSSISVPNFEAVGLCVKRVIEPILLMILVLSYELIDNGT